MKEANRAPAYAVIYHGLAEVARKHGYALAIHGSVITDLDLIAAPWTDLACDAQRLAEVLSEHAQACLALESRGLLVAESKPHGRMAFNLYMGAGAKVDLSVLPRQLSN